MVSLPVSFHDDSIHIAALQCQARAFQLFQAFSQVMYIMYVWTQYLPSQTSESIEKAHFWC